MKTSIVLVILLYFAVAFATQRTKQCKKPSDCKSNECCVIGLDPLSMPQCAARGKEDDWCRENAVPEDRMLYYPNQDVQTVQGVYAPFCPCDEGYSCKKIKCAIG